jgi:hypothetical protein
MRFHLIAGGFDFFPVLQVIQYRFSFSGYFTKLSSLPNRSLGRAVAKLIQSVLDGRWTGEGPRFRTRWRLADAVPCVQPEMASLVFLSAAARARIVPARPAQKLSTENGPTNLADNPNFEKLIPRYSRVILTNRDSISRYLLLNYTLFVLRNRSPDDTQKLWRACNSTSS